MEGKISYKPLVCIILDGWGISPNWQGNAISIGQPKFINNLWREYPHKVLIGYDQERSEFCTVSDSRHAFTEISAGTPIFQDQEIIDNSIKDKSFYKNRTFLDCIKYARENNSSIHLIGVLSDVGFHSHISHIKALIELFHRNNFSRVFVDAILDGVDTDKIEGLSFLKDIQSKFFEVGLGSISSIVGRNWAIGNNPQKTSKTLDMLYNQKAEKAKNFESALNHFYKRNIFDSNIPPTMIKVQDSFQTIKESDVVIFFNYRAEPIKNFVSMFLEYPNRSENIMVATFSKYSKKLMIPTAFPRSSNSDVLPAIFAKYNKKNIRITEKSKESHITTFFNGGRSEPFGGEERIIIDSNKNKDDFMMNTPNMTNAVINVLRSKKFDFILVNYPNADKIAHTGNIKIASETVKFLDTEIKKVVGNTINMGGAVILMSDHGNIEQIEVKKNIRKSKTIHTTNPVPFIFITKKNKKNLLQGALTSPFSALSKIVLAKNTLSDVAPTILEIMELPKSDSMIGHSFYKYLE